MRRFRFLLLILFASFAGVYCSELACRSAVFQNYIGRKFGWAADLVVMKNLRRASRDEQIDSAKVDRELSLLQAQFGDEETYLQRLGESELTIPSLRELITDQLRSLQWIEKRIAAEAPSTELECKGFYDKLRASFVQPARCRASHIFFAAPAETPPDLVETKRNQIDAIAARLAQGEAFSDLAAEASEDEATKWIGGDLGFFAAGRMPPEFFSQVEKLNPGRPGSPFQSHLGFHIVEVTDTRPPGELPFENVRTEISLALSNQRRALIAGRLADMLMSATDPSKPGSAGN